MIRKCPGRFDMVETAIQVTVAGESLGTFYVIFHEISHKAVIVYHSKEHSKRERL
jgi:hypothetical protein